MTAVITVLSGAHANAYRALMLHAYEHAADAFTSTPSERSVEPEAWWLNRVENPHGMTVAFGAFLGSDSGGDLGGDLVGTVSLEFSTKTKTRHKALVVAMFVTDKARRQGIAGRLMQAAIALCRTRGDIEVVQLEVTQGNDSAISLYREAGFEPYGVEPMAVRTPTGFLSKIHMWLQLDPDGRPSRVSPSP